MGILIQYNLIQDFFTKMDSDRGDNRGNSKVYVSNLNVAFTEDDLRKQFEKYGAIENLSLKQKDTFSFAFIEYQNPKDAEQAIQAMNKKVFDGKQIKVEFSRSNGRRDFASNRGGRFGGDRDRGDRGGYRGGRDRDNGFRKYDDRGPRRDFGDRPKGCFNCGKEGHFAKDCQQPRKPRQFNRDRNDNRGGDRSFKRRSRSRSGDRHRKHRKRSSSGSSRS